MVPGDAYRWARLPGELGLDGMAQRREMSLLLGITAVTSPFLRTRLAPAEHTSLLPFCAHANEQRQWRLGGSCFFVLSVRLYPPFLSSDLFRHAQGHVLWVVNLVFFLGLLVAPHLFDDLPERFFLLAEKEASRLAAPLLPLCKFLPDDVVRPNNIARGHKLEVFCGPEPATTIPVKEVYFNKEFSSTQIESSLLNQQIIASFSATAGPSYIRIERSTDGRYNLRDGWKDFVADANIKKGDTCAFHMYKKNGKVKLMVLVL
uniref:TF-B3 domain-containing protein n=1 Tax=Leersia perrieri TaxID=77586 RepID=A0A0D9XXD0_9ORYZ